MVAVRKSSSLWIYGRYRNLAVTGEVMYGLVFDMSLMDPTSSRLAPKASRTCVRRCSSSSLCMLVQRPAAIANERSCHRLCSPWYLSRVFNGAVQMCHRETAALPSPGRRMFHFVALAIDNNSAMELDRSESIV